MTETKTPDPRFNAKRLYDIYQMKIRIRERICGGLPKNPDLLEGFIKAKTGHNDEITKEQVAEAKEAILEPTVEQSWCCFHGDKEKGLYILTRNLKSMLKQGASMLRFTVKKTGCKQIFHEGAEVKALDGGSRIYLGKMKPDGFKEGPIHVTGPQGPRSAIKRMDYVENVELEFQIWVLHTTAGETRHIGENDLIEVLTFSQENGFGADRSQGEGKFDVLGFEQIQVGDLPNMSKVDKEEKITKPAKKNGKEIAPS
jgi:hypothetical protein